MGITQDVELTCTENDGLLQLCLEQQLAFDAALTSRSPWEYWTYTHTQHVSKGTPKPEMLPRLLLKDRAAVERFTVTGPFKKECTGSRCLSEGGRD